MEDGNFAKGVNKIHDALVKYGGWKTLLYEEFTPIEGDPRLPLVARILRRFRKRRINCVVSGGYPTYLAGKFSTYNNIDFFLVSAFRKKNVTERFVLKTSLIVKGLLPKAKQTSCKLYERKNGQRFACLMKFQFDQCELQFVLYNHQFSSPLELIRQIWLESDLTCFNHGIVLIDNRCRFVRDAASTHCIFPARQKNATKLVYWTRLLKAYVVRSECLDCYEFWKEFLENLKKSPADVTRMGCGKCAASTISPPSLKALVFERIVDYKSGRREVRVPDIVHADEKSGITYRMVQQGYRREINAK